MSSPPLPTRDLDEILAATAPLWQEMRGERLFLTGGTGFFGCWLVESFLHCNRALQLHAQVTVLTRDPDAFLRKVPHLRDEGALTLHAGDVRDFAFPIGPFGFVLHAATEASAKQLEEHPHEMLSTILAGTERVLSFAAQASTRTLLLTSSGAVYGPQPSGISHVTEGSTGAPDSLQAGSIYGEGKRAGGVVVRAGSADRAGGKDCALLRVCRTASAAGRSFCRGQFCVGRTAQACDCHCVGRQFAAVVSICL